MKLRLEHGLASIEATLTFRGRDLRLSSVVLDTGSVGSIFSADLLLGIAINPEPLDTLRRIRGVGGVDLVAAEAAIDFRHLELWRSGNLE
jgi:hypothetical protein